MPVEAKDAKHKIAASSFQGRCQHSTHHLFSSTSHAALGLCIVTPPRAAGMLLLLHLMHLAGMAGASVRCLQHGQVVLR